MCSSILDAGQVSTQKNYIHFSTNRNMYKINEVVRLVIPHSNDLPGCFLAATVRPDREMYSNPACRNCLFFILSSFDQELVWTVGGSEVSVLSSAAAIIHHCHSFTHSVTTWLL